MNSVNKCYVALFLFSFVLVLSDSAGADVPGDFDGNGVVDSADFDYFWDCYECLDPRLDIDGNGAKDQQDFQILVEELGNTYFGDANLDGEFNSSDFVAVFKAGEYEDTVSGNSSWSEGDWNGDREFDSADFVTAFLANGYELGPRPPRQIVGDFSGNGMLDLDDINMLLVEIAAGQGEGFDLNDDGLVDRADIRIWVEELKGTYLGDANLDGAFDTSDMVLVFQAGKYEQDVEALWHEGDWTGDLHFDSSDFVAAVANIECWGDLNGFGCGPHAVNAVPEPAWPVWLIVCCGMAWLRAGRGWA